MFGTARFNPNNPHEFLYREEGLFIGAITHNIYQDYLYKLQDDKILLFFHEKPPRLFLELKFNHLHATGTHVCKCDLYRAFFHFEGTNHFTTKYIVNGPHKNFSIVTQYEKSYC